MNLQKKLQKITNTEQDRQWSTVLCAVVEVLMQYSKVTNKVTSVGGTEVTSFSKVPW